MLMFSLYLFNNFVVKNYRTGMDERIYFTPFLRENTSTIYNIFKIQENIEKIHFLELTNISIDDKLFEIYKNVPKQISMYNGGLFNDWDFDF